MPTRNALLVHEECEFTVVDMTTNTVTLNTGPTLLVFIHVNIVLDANPCDIENVAGTPAITLEASLAAGTFLDLHGARFEDALIVNPDDAAASGQIIVGWRKVSPAPHRLP